MICILRLSTNRGQVIIVTENCIRVFYFDNSMDIKRKEKNYRYPPTMFYIDDGGAMPFLIFALDNLSSFPSYFI